MSATPDAATAANPHTPLRRQPPSPGQVFLSIHQACARYAVHRTTLYRWMGTRGFPRPLQFSTSCARIPLAAIESWEATQQQAGR